MLKILLCYIHTCFFVYQFFPGLGLLFLLKSLFKFIYIYFPLFEESFQFKFLQWLESSEYLGFNLVFLLQQVDRFLAVYMHLTYYEVNILISCFRGVNIKSEKCQIHVGSKNIICVFLFQDVTIKRTFTVIVVSKIMSLLVPGVWIFRDPDIINMPESDIFYCKENTKLRIYAESYLNILIFGVTLLNSVYAWRRKGVLNTQIAPAPNMVASASAINEAPRRMEIRRNSEDPFKFQKVFVIAQTAADREAAQMQCWPVQSDLYQKLKLGRLHLVFYGI